MNKTLQSEIERLAKKVVVGEILEKVLSGEGPLDG